MQEIFRKGRKGCFMFGLFYAVSGIGGGNLAAWAENASMPNLGEEKRAVSSYYESGAYQRDFDQVIAQAQDYILKTASGVKNPAVVFDIDETILSNWPEIKANDFGYVMDGPCDRLPSGPCGDIAWMEQGNAPAFPSSLALIRRLQDRHIAIFLLTGRSETYRASMERNLKKVGVTNIAGLYMRPEGNKLKAEDYKTPVRAMIESKGYQIIASIGDQPSDIKGGHMMRGFVLPNPFYSVP